MTPVWRRGTAALLTLAVLALHLWVADSALESNWREALALPRPQRIQVSLVRELVPTAPLVALPSAPRLQPPRAPRLAVPEIVVQALPAEPAASQPKPKTVAEAAEAASAAAPPAASAPGSPASAVAANSASAPDFAWPPSTRLSYVLTGNYRGPVDGSAQVEWLRDGQRYQVHLDVFLGPAFAPLVARSMSSDGVLGEHGLVPLRYDEETRTPLRSPRRRTMHFDGERVVLTNGKQVPQPPGVQDTASQFVQLTWLFTTRPELLVPGRAVELPLALPHRVEPWTYDIVGFETLETRFGPVEAVHIKPRRTARADTLTAEIWVAPSMQYLPVRILIRQDEDTWADLLVVRMPQQAAPGR